MNFRPTLKKIVWSIIIAIVVWMLTYVPTICGPDNYCPFMPTSFWLSLSSLVLVYVIWSLIQKNKRK